MCVSMEIDKSRISVPYVQEKPNSMNFMGPWSNSREQVPSSYRVLRTRLVTHAPKAVEALPGFD